MNDLTLSARLRHDAEEAPPVTRRLLLAAAEYIEELQQEIINLHGELAKQRFYISYLRKVRGLEEEE